MSREKRERASPAKIADRRGKVLKLASLQARLRFLLRRRQEELGDSVNALKHVFGGKVPSFIYKFLNGKRAICGGALLEAITSELDCHSLSKEIVTSTTGLNDRLQGLSALSEDIINLVFDLMEAFASCPEDLNSKSFAACFAPYQEVVAGALTSSREQIQRLESPRVNESVRDLLKDNKWREKIETGPTKLSQLNNLVERLVVQFKEKREVAKLLGLHRDTLTRALKGKIPDKTIDRLIRRAKKLLRSSGSEAEPRSETTSEIEHGGETSPLGVKYVLGEDSFQELDFDPGEESIKIARKSFERVRAMLNILCQIRNDEVRAEVQKKLTPEVEELELAIRSFTTKYPNQLTGLHDLQRETWARDDKKRKRIKSRTRNRGGR